MDMTLDQYNNSDRQNEPWLDFCSHETLLPGSPWHKVLDKIGVVFAEKVRPLLDDPQERQMIFKLLGKDYVQKHFSDYPNDPSLLHPPNMSNVEHENTEKNTQIWLWNQWIKTAEQLGCHLTGDGPTELSAEMTHFVNHAFTLIENKMNLLLAEHEAKNESGIDNELGTWTSFLTRRPKSVDSKDLSFAIHKMETFHLKNDKGVAGKPNRPPSLSCSGAEVLGNAVGAIIALESSAMAMVCNRLSGHLLPKSLRRLIWMDKLLRFDTTFKGVKINLIEKETRERYGRKLEHKCAELKIRSATRSPISGLIENAVVEKFRSTPSMYQFATDEQMINESSKSLNVLYVYNGTYEPYFIHWLFPLQMAFKQIAPKAEHPYELFMYLHLLIKNIFPSWMEIFAMAERVMVTLQTEDAELFTHLQRSFQTNLTFNPKDFLVELIARERKEALKLYASSSNLESIANSHEELLASPVIFLRKWMGECFVSSLDVPAVLLIWDQLFMQNWNHKVMESFCLVILMLLKDSIMAARDYPAIRQILLSDGYHLLTADIQRAWIHLQQGGLLADIPGMNQLNARQVRDLSPRLQDRNSRDVRKLLSFGVKDIVLKIMSTENTDKSSSTWLRDFDPMAVALTFSIHYGGMNLHSKTSFSKPVLLENVRKNEATTKPQKRNLFLMQFNDLFEFDSIDLSEYSNYTKSGEMPFLLIEAIYNDGERAPKPLGWTKVSAFEQETRSTRDVWKPREFSSLISLHPGKEPDNNNESPPGSSTSGSHDSSIELTVYDPTKEYQHRISNVTVEKRNVTEMTPSSIPPWVQHNEFTSLPHPSTLQEPFDLYIDTLHYIPDCATITKVSAQILKPGRRSLPAISILPRINSSARNPVFSFCQLLNKEDEKLNVNTNILFQVTTVDLDSGNVAVIGNCMLRVFTNEGKLNVGGFQLKLKTGLPPKKLDSLAPSDLQEYTAFPCCSLLVRLLPHAELSQPVPSYSSGYYFTDEAKPTRSEFEIMSTFQQDVLFPKSVKDMAEQLMEKDQNQVQENQLNDWYEKRIGVHKSSMLHPSLNYCNIHHVSRYRQHIGLRIQIKQAFGLEVEGLYINAFARILKGAQSSKLAELPQHWGGEEKLLTRQHDFTSLQRSPRWTDTSVVLHPYLDSNTVLLVQLFGMSATYIPHARGDQRGHVISQSGQQLELHAPLGWTVFPLFERQYVYSGIHSAPLFQGLPNAGFLQSLSETSVKAAIEEGLKKKTLALHKSYGSITVKIWGGHYFEDEHYALLVVNDLLTVSNIKKFLATQSNKKGKEMSVLVTESLVSKQRNIQRKSPEYIRHQQFYEEAMGEKFYDLIEMALLNAGYGPL
ncbi:uncharacterized protein LOC135031779 isoform X2 [Pseudophryne corroboree]|uniref:uncharacterized protein LOC135031779 isoform X2 n=1 Tax=Pseudophryne corroboree TaxID=495146 RepID=UPI003081407B